MAGLCEGGNEPSGSLKAICNKKNSHQYMFRNSSHSCHYRRCRTYRFSTEHNRIMRSSGKLQHHSIINSEIGQMDQVSDSETFDQEYISVEDKEVKHRYQKTKL
ncbi:hypothetical protein ANN_16859 [Periplaneta americana]|uniref:Uncharacterized protein n=1 Tax=Periplaneta americana TaxID=6978 RepID=A0ABQ8SSP9_PERAM|nr:hypothetical protein ANN_16859 [Periplaneta americana]